MTKEKPLIPNREARELTEVDKIARFYGFQPLIPPNVEKQDWENIKGLEQSAYLAEKAAFLRMYFEEKMTSLPQPSMFYCGRPLHGSKEKKKPMRIEGALVSLGSSKSACECLSIQTGIAMLNEMGYKNVEVHINSIGDKDSVNEFQKTLAAFVRKNYSSLSPDLRQAIKKDSFAVLKEHENECQNLQIECPKSIDFLSESSRSHFKEILEFLETMDIPYQIDHHLVGDPDIGSETIFSLNEETELASGFRFNRLAKKIGFKKDLAGIVLNISAKPKKRLKKVKAKTVKPHFYLIQFGPEAKLKSFLVLRELQKAGVEVVHSIARDKLGSQINTAEAAGVPYIILIGQKEALENSIIVRNSITRAQEVVPIPEFAAKVKSLIKTDFA